LARAKKVPLQEALALAAAGDGGLGSRAREGAKGLAAALREARERIEAGEVAAACRWLLDEVAYRGAVEELYADPMAAQARWQAVEELLAWVQVWGERNRGEAFGSFLGLLALEVEGEGREDKRDDKRGVWLMTLHSAKGLEFPAVFIPGLEEEILPHRKSIDEGDAAIEEERRLLYVGITRARWLLFLSTALSRVAWGQARARIPSRFLTEIEDPGLLRRESYTMPCATAPEELKEILTRYKGARKQ
jgi:superfamily I DNA/RNA helicase